MLWWLLYEATDGSAPAFMIVLSVSAGAWLAGYITPGASGGIGVRDALLILALKPFVGKAIIYAVVAFRAATILGERFTVADLNVACIFSRLNRDAGMDLSSMVYLNPDSPDAPCVSTHWLGL